MPRDPVVGVLALQGDVREHLATLRALGAEAVTVNDVRLSARSLVVNATGRQISASG